MEGDLLRADLLRRAQIVREANPDTLVYFKFTCSHCGERCTLADANTLWEKGECYACGKETVIDKGGFMLVYGLSKGGK